MADMEKYKKFYDSIAPSAGDEELHRAVIGRKAERMKTNGTTKKHSKKALVISIAAAAAILSTAAVGAANGWDYIGVFSKVFYNADANTSGGFDFVKYGKEIDEWYHGQDFDVHVIGAAADSGSIYMLYDVVRNGDWEDICDVRATASAALDDAGGLWWNGIANGCYGAEENTLHFMAEYTADEIQGVTLRPRFGTVTVYDYEEKLVKLWFASPQDCEIPIDFPVCEEKRVYEVNKDFAPFESGTVYHVESVEVTPFRFKINMTNGAELFLDSWSDIRKKIDGKVLTDEELFGTMEWGYILRDGTKITDYKDKGINWASENEYTNAFPCPIDPDEIAVLIPVPGFEIPLI